MMENDKFIENEIYRKGIDRDGYYDIISYGSAYKITIYHKGNTYDLTAKNISRIIPHLKGYHGQWIRLISCNTGSKENGFAQNLANKLGVLVKAPNNIIWSYGDKSGRLDIAPRRSNNKSSQLYSTPDLKNKGEFVTFYPKRRKI